MKHIYTLVIICLTFGSVFGQLDNFNKNGLIESEMKAASRSALDVNVNPNTLN